MPAGRPTKYKKVYAQQLLDYFDVEPYEVEEQVLKLANGTKRVKKGYVANDLPTLEKFASQIGVNDDTLQNWADAKNEDGTRKHPEFFGAYRAAKNMQKHILITNGLRGLYASNFAIFVAQNLMGMRDKSELDITSKGERIDNSVNLSNYKDLMNKPREELEQLVREQVRQYR